MSRPDGRQNDEIRPIKITRQYSKYARGSVLFELGDTKILVTTSVDERTPRHVKEDHGWLTAEYSMLPGATHTRNQRERMRVSGRTSEIQRLIGRCLRAAVDLTKTGERTFTIDCDVIQADGGTRTASITAGYIAIYDALNSLKSEGLIDEIPMRFPIAAISVGMVENEVVLDLNYEEDSNAEVDSNIIMNSAGEIIEMQTTSERAPLTRDNLTRFLEVGEKGIKQLMALQAEALGILEGVS